MHLSGGKVTKTHTTAIAEAGPVVKLADALPEVSKIVLGVITQGLPRGQARLKCLPIVGGLRVDVRGASSKQQVYVYTSSPTKTEAALSQVSLAE